MFNKKNLLNHSHYFWGRLVYSYNQLTESRSGFFKNFSLPLFTLAVIFTCFTFVIV